MPCGPYQVVVAVVFAPALVPAAPLACWLSFAGGVRALRLPLLPLQPLFPYHLQ
jgi:hypothetical protein